MDNSLKPTAQDVLLFHVQRYNNLSNKQEKKDRKVWSFTKKYVILHPETHCVITKITKHSYEKNIPTL